jgi:hypothetical protein
MIVTVDIAESGARKGIQTLARPPRGDEVPGLRHAETVFTAPMTPRLLPIPNAAPWR